MNCLNKTSVKTIARNLAVLLLAFSAIATFASLGDGSKKNKTSTKSLLSNKTGYNSGVFSLKSGYTYRGNQVINTFEVEKFIRLNTVVTTKRGNTTYIVPLKKNVILDRIKFNPSNK